MYVKVKECIGINWKGRVSEWVGFNMQINIQINYPDKLSR